MAQVKALVLRAAGTNCDAETAYALELAGAAVSLVHVNRLAKEAEPFGDCQIIALPGGFTYGDDVASGKVLAVELAHVLGDKFNAFVAGGGLIIGICNGFQVLVKTGLLPGAKFTRASERQTTLTFNDSQKFECRWSTLRAEKNTVAVCAAPEEVLAIPVAHGEGKFLCRDAAMLAALAENGQVVYRYASAAGGTDDAVAYPDDPNGSAGHIAGICDPSGRVFGLMPHPERHIFAHQHPRWTRGEAAADGAGLKMFQRAVTYFK